MHSGITGLVEMVYNPPPTGHVVLILDNQTTAMTGLQEHPGTGRALNHEPATQVMVEDLARSIGLDRVEVIDAQRDMESLDRILRECLESEKLCLIIARSPCILSARKLRELQKQRKGDA